MVKYLKDHADLHNNKCVKQWACRHLKTLPIFYISRKPPRVMKKQRRIIPKKD